MPVDDSQGTVALLAGASGLVGRELLELLIGARDFSRIYAVTRRQLGREHPRLANRIVQFERLESQLKGMACHTAFCCLGAHRGDARTAAAARAIELDYVVAFARSAKLAGAQRFVFLSCAAAQARSEPPALRYKLEAERALEGMDFASLDILQPGPLLALRREMTPIDLVRFLGMPLVNTFLVGAREMYRGVPARLVAQAMLGAARSGRRGVYRYTYAALQALATAPPPRIGAKAPGGAAAVPKSSRPP